MGHHSPRGNNMTDDQIDADIERMLTVRHNRQTLGYSYYEAGSQGRVRMARDPAKIREYKRTYRNRGHRYDPSPAALDRDLNDIQAVLDDIAHRCPLGPTEILLREMRAA
jgi:hypothetical protein